MRVPLYSLRDSELKHITNRIIPPSETTMVPLYSLRDSELKHCHDRHIMQVSECAVFRCTR